LSRVILPVVLAARLALTVNAAAEEAAVFEAPSLAGVFELPISGSGLNESSAAIDPAAAGFRDEPVEAWMDQWEAKLAALPSTSYPTLKWSGFLQVDSGWFLQDAASVTAVGDVQDKTGLRRVRLRAHGFIRPTTSYVVDLDFAASGHPSFRDVMLAFHELSFLQNVKFGYFQQPFSMNAMTSGQELIVMERWLPFAFAPFRQVGLGAEGTSSGERAHWAISAFRFPTDSFGRSEGGSGGYALAGRFTCLPWYRNQGDHLLHVGFGYSLGDPGDNLVQYQIQPGFFVTDSSGSAEAGGGSGVPVFVDTGPIPTNTFSLFNAELAANYGPLHLSSEVTYAVVDQRGGPTVAFSGAYAQAGYCLTGESRPYNRRKGVFDQPRPNHESGPCGIGAWELVAGWSYIDLNDKNIRGGYLSDFILGLNWYLNPLAKIQINYVDSFLQDPTEGKSEASIVGIRAQFRF
jgi:phosphate-selective porin OprO/OprP